MGPTGSIGADHVCSMSDGPEIKSKSFLLHYVFIAESKCDPVAGELRDGVLESVAVAVRFIGFDDGELIPGIVEDFCGVVVEELDVMVLEERGEAVLGSFPEAEVVDLGGDDFLEGFEVEVDLLHGL